MQEHVEKCFLRCYYCCFNVVFVASGFFLLATCLPKVGFESFWRYSLFQSMLITIWYFSSDSKITRTLGIRLGPKPGQGLSGKWARNSYKPFFPSDALFPPYSPFQKYSFISFRVITENGKKSCQKSLINLIKLLICELHAGTTVRVLKV